MLSLPLGSPLHSQVTDAGPVFVVGCDCCTRLQEMFPGAGGTICSLCVWSSAGSFVQPGSHLTESYVSLTPSCHNSAQSRATLLPRFQHAARCPWSLLRISDSSVPEEPAVTKHHVSKVSYKRHLAVASVLCLERVSQHLSSSCCCCLQPLALLLSFPCFKTSATEKPGLSLPLSHAVESSLEFAHLSATDLACVIICQFCSCFIFLLN